MKKYAAHGITGIRILLSVLLLFFPVYSLGFFVCYLLCGLTDIATAWLRGTFGRLVHLAQSLTPSQILCLQRLP